MILSEEKLPIEVKNKCEMCFDCLILISQKYQISQWRDMLHILNSLFYNFLNEFPFTLPIAATGKLADGCETVLVN